MTGNFDKKIEESKNRILNSFSGYSKPYFLSAWGNIGDELIYQGTKNLLAEFQYEEINILDLKDETGDVALVCGSGGWTKHFNQLPTYLPKIAKQFKKVIVLPSTYVPQERSIHQILTSVDALYFAREIVSYDQIKELCNADIAFDCAFYFNYEPYKKNGNGVLNAFRTDKASIWTNLPPQNNDISLSCSTLIEWLEIIANHEIVRTDRAHVMVAAAMLGKQVEYTTAIDHKVPAIAEYSLQELNVIQIPDPFCTLNNYKSFTGFANRVNESLPSILNDEKIIQFSEHFSRLTASKTVILDGLNFLEHKNKYPSDSLVIIPDGMKSLLDNPNRCNQLTELLHDVKKTILVDDIDSFLDIELLKNTIMSTKLPMEFVGYTRNTDNKIKYVTILSNSPPITNKEVPKDFSVIAIMAAYNEIDVIESSVNHLFSNNIGVYFIDNWSTDGTYEKAQELYSQGKIIGIERWPAKGPSDFYDSGGILKRKEELSFQLDANWLIHHDVDEIRESPWEGINLREAIYYVDSLGYNAVDFTVLIFPPIDNSFKPGSNFEDHFNYFTFAATEDNFVQIKLWKKTDAKIDMERSGGHNISFAGRKVFPYKFLLKHYPIRSQYHGEKKVLLERKPRWNENKRKLGWHIHYDSTDSNTSFLKNRKGLFLFDDNFYTDFLLERLSGIGIVKKIQTNENTGKIVTERTTTSLNENNETILSDYFAHRYWNAFRPIRRIKNFLKNRNPFRKWKEYFSIKYSGLFDQEYYLRNNLDVLNSDIDPLMHFILNGWKERRNPSVKFNTNFYLENNPDVLQSEINPLYHYLKFGKKEGRFPKQE